MAFRATESRSPAKQESYGHTAGSRASYTEGVPRRSLWVGIFAAVALSLTVLGPLKLELGPASIYVGVLLFLLVGAAISYWYLINISLPLPPPAVIGIVAIAAAVLLAGTEIARGVVSLALVPVAGMTIGVKSHRRVLWLAALLALLPLTIAATGQASDPQSFLSSSYREGNQGVSLTGEGELPRLPATFPGPSIAGAAELCLLAVLLLCANLEGTRTSRVLTFIGVAAYTVLLLLTYTRGVIAGYLVGLCAVLLSRPLSKRVKVILLLGAAASALAIAAPMEEAFTGRASLESRAHVFQEGLEVWRLQPLTGVGFSRFPAFASAPGGGPLFHAHFFPIHYLAEIGPLGLVGILLLTATTVVKSWGNPKSRAVTLAIITLVLVDAGVLLYDRTAALYWLTAGIAISGHELRRAQHSG
jgi:O-antigen ligase